MEGLVLLVSDTRTYCTEVALSNPEHPAPRVRVHSTLHFLKVFCTPENITMRNASPCAGLWIIIKSRRWHLNNSSSDHPPAIFESTFSSFCMPFLISVGLLPPRSTAQSIHFRHIIYPVFRTPAELIHILKVERDDTCLSQYYPLDQALMPAGFQRNFLEDKGLNQQRGGGEISRNFKNKKNKGFTNVTMDRPTIDRPSPCDVRAVGQRLLYLQKRKL